MRVNVGLALGVGEGVRDGVRLGVTVDVGDPQGPPNIWVTMMALKWALSTEPEPTMFSTPSFTSISKLLSKAACWPTSA